MAEIEKLGMKYRVALRYHLQQSFNSADIQHVCSSSFPSKQCFLFDRIAKDPRFEHLPCAHKGTYADDCLVQRVTQVK